MELVALIVLLALLEYVFIVGMVGAARGKYGITAPATTGHPEFERLFRIQQNTLEQLVVFIPAVMLFGWYLHALSAAVLGLGFIIGRAMYYSSYRKDAEKRGPGMLISFFINVILILGALAGIILDWIR